jgi:hypothetical protein
MPKKATGHSFKQAKKLSKSIARPAKANLVTGQPIFAQPKPSPDPSGFKDPVTDQKYQELTALGGVPQPRGGAGEPIVTLQQVYGSDGVAKVQESSRQVRSSFIPWAIRAASSALRPNRWSRTRW